MVGWLVVICVVCVGFCIIVVGLFGCFVRVGVGGVLAFFSLLYCLVRWGVGGCVVCLIGLGFDWFGV